MNPLIDREAINFQSEKRANLYHQPKHSLYNEDQMVTNEQTFSVPLQVNKWPLEVYSIQDARDPRSQSTLSRFKEIRQQRLEASHSFPRGKCLLLVPPRLGLQIFYFC